MLFRSPAVSTEYIENSEPTARPSFKAWYPGDSPLCDSLREMLLYFDLQCPFAHIDDDARTVEQELLRALGDVPRRANFQIQALTSLFYRNKGAYAVGKLINGFRELPFALPILHNEAGQLYIDAALIGEEDMLMLFSFARAYFMVDMEIPSAYVQFLRSMMPHKPRAEIYNALGLAKQDRKSTRLNSSH